MATLEDLKIGASVEGIVPGVPVSNVSAKWHGSSGATVVYRDDASGNVGQQLLFRSDEHRLRVLEDGRHWAFDGDGALFRLVFEAQRIRLAYLFDPLLAVHISNVVPLPHFYGSVKLSELKVSSGAVQVAEEVIRHLAGLVDSEVEVVMEVRAKAPGGIPESVIRTVSENAATLKFKTFEFEEE